MDEYAELLSIINITIPTIPQDLSIHDSRTRQQIEYDYTYGPQDWLWNNNQNTSCNLDTNGFGMEFTDEVRAEKAKNAIHHYSRRDRFKVTLRELLIIHSNIPISLLEDIKTTLVVYGKHNIWDRIRTILKKSKFTKYYNCIPEIILFCSGMKPCIPDEAYIRILQDFDRMSFGFESIRDHFGIKYFPNLRYVSLKLARRHGVSFPYKVVELRTARKLRELNEVFDYFNLGDVLVEQGDLALIQSGEKTQRFRKYNLQ
jgi:hypothetical protein